MSGSNIQMGSCRKYPFYCTKSLLVFSLTVWAGIILNQNVIVCKAHEVATLRTDIALLKALGLFALLLGYICRLHIGLIGEGYGNANGNSIKQNVDWAMT